MIVQRLAEFAQTDSFSAPALDVMRLSLLDWCAVGLAGQAEPVAMILRDQALSEGGTAVASLIGHPQRVPPRMAALVNGAISHALDYDDTHFAHIGHPSVVVIPAALSVAQLTGATLDDMLEAALIGAEASVRVGLWLGRSHYQAGFHQTGTAGAYGATLAAARLLGLSTDQTVMALGLVSTRASGLIAQFGTMGKPMNAGIAASNGVEAALLAHRGFISRGDAMDGPQGFAQTHHGTADDTALDGLGGNWIFEEVSHKSHACCHGLHAMLEALTPLIGTDPEQIKQIEVKTNPRWLAVCNLPAPKTGLEAKFSYRMTAAMRILGYDTGHPSSFNDFLFLDNDIKNIRDKINVISCGAISEMQVGIEVKMTAGPTQHLTYDLNAVASLDHRRDRVRQKAAVLLNDDRAKELWTRLNLPGPADQIGEFLGGG